MFSTGQILISAGVGALTSLVVVAVYSRLVKPVSGAAALRSVEQVLLAAVVGLSIMLWRMAGNTPSLNDDAIPLVSPNDVLCPVLTYVCLGVFDGIRQVQPGGEWQRVRALLTLVSLVVNVVTI
ncbi:MAG: hypothetical protein NVSMB2_12090 [Chloroflexota bacterium]